MSHSIQLANPRRVLLERVWLTASVDVWHLSPVSDLNLERAVL